MIIRPRYRGKRYLEPPAQPTGLTATPVSPRKIQLDWTDNANNEDLYGVWVFLPGDPVPDPLPSPAPTELAANSIQHLSASNPDGTQLRYIVAAGRLDPDAPSGQRIWSNEVQILATHEADNPPAVPTVTDFSQNSGSPTTQLDFSWTTTDDREDLTEFRAYIREQGDTTWIPYTANAISRHASGPITFVGLIAGTTYEAKIDAINTQGTAASAIATATTQSATVPDTPTLDAFAHISGEEFEGTFTNTDALLVEVHREYSEVGASGPWTYYDQFADVGLPLLLYPNGQHTLDGTGFIYWCRIPGFTTGQVWTRCRVRRDGLYSAYSNVATVTV